MYVYSSDIPVVKPVTTDSVWSVFGDEKGLYSILQVRYSLCKLYIFSVYIATLIWYVYRATNSSS